MSEGEERKNSSAETPNGNTNRPPSPSDIHAIETVSDKLEEAMQLAVQAALNGSEAAVRAAEPRRIHDSQGTVGESFSNWIQQGGSLPSDGYLWPEYVCK